MDLGLLSWPSRVGPVQQVKGLRALNLFLLLEASGLTLSVPLPSAVPLRGIAVVPAGVWIRWADPCPCLQTAMGALSARPRALANQGGSLQDTVQSTGCHLNYVRPLCPKTCLHCSPHAWAFHI